MRRHPSIASLLSLFVLGAASGCGDGNNNTTGSGGSGASTTTATTTATGGNGGTGGTGTTTTEGGGGSGGTGGDTTGGGGTGGTGGGTGGGWVAPDPVVDCNVPDFDPPADAKATCEVTKPGSAGMVLRGTLLLPDQVIHKGEVLISAAGKIVCAACDCSAEAGFGEATVVTCADGVISPGLINTHDHITFANNDPKAHGDERFEHRHDWRQGKNGHTEISYSSNASAAAQRLQELRFLMSGATSVSGSNGPTGLLRNLDQATKMEGIDMPAVLYVTFPLADGGSGFMDNNINDGCSYNGMVDNASKIAGLNAYEPHISEGINTAALNEFLCTSSTPPPSGANDIVEPQTAIVHGVALSAAEVKRIRDSRAKVIWSARTNIDLYGNTAPVSLLDRLGVPIALGTDWIVSGSMNMLREFACVDSLNKDYFDGHFTDKQLWQMATTNAALALGAQKVTGLLLPDRAADIAIFNGKTNKDYRAVVGAELSDVVLVLRGGEVLYGDEAVVNALRPECEPMIWNGGMTPALAFNDVCGLPKRACVAADLQGAATLAGVLAVSESLYPLFFQCGAQVDKEPSCVPYHAAYPAGQSGTIYTQGIQPGVDDDGDGIPNAADNCPQVFNPVRPMDGGKQPDSDGDGLGDVCDKCPLAAGEGCTPLDANDVDGDGVWNAYDNCPYHANTDQADNDGDGNGNACDKCPDLANPGYAECPLTPLPIAALRDPNHPMHPALMTKVTITDVYVTALRQNTGASRGFYVQDTTLQPFSGIFVFTGNNPPNVSVGNKVTITGNYDEFNGLSEIVSPAVVIGDSGTVLPFDPLVIPNPMTIVTPATAEPYESMLLKVLDVVITNANPDAPSDFDEFAVTGGLRINDFLFDNMQNVGLNNNCPVGTGFKSISGIHAFSFSNWKLEPRFAGDVELLDAAQPNFCQPF